ncbi:DNA-directed RNA polymerase I subunit RPA49-like isoform X3 [Macrosteles quadrilineatus]|uniref:DNA-directed RNA polymerase I subunit RPA49-like isoform X3 n=1 Tax=Macrosteles quadrilineatus TaxID=74068 RepID=UPI0023E1E1C7|nr:DNA-directed RNA polymerase I subunit RPA49-like isoform X3 [Macrosteles quadrilineatus]
MEPNDNSTLFRPKIKSVIAKNSGMKPLIVNLDSGPLPEEELKKSECLWYEDESDHSKLKVVLENSNENTFEGSVNLNSKICRTMLVLHNKKKNKVQLVDLIECQLQKALSKPTLQSNYDNDEIETTYEDNRNKLLKQFGSKRANRASDIGSKMRINSEMMTTQIKHTAADVSVDVSEIQMADSSTDHCLPVCHRDATNLEGVYRYEDFFTESEWASLEDEATVVFNVIPFTQEESGLRNVTMDDKVVIHILVLIIITCEFSCNTEELSRYLPRFSVKKIREIARALSLTTKDKITWFLKLPLPPQRSVFMRRRKN